MPDPIAPIAAAATQAVTAAKTAVIDDKNAARAAVAKSPIKAVAIAAGIGAAIILALVIAFKAFHG